MFVGQTDHLLTNEILRDKNFILNLYTLSNFQLEVIRNCFGFTLLRLVIDPEESRVKVIRNCFGFTLLRLVIDPEESRHFLKQSKCKTESRSRLGYRRFPAL